MKTITQSDLKWYEFFLFQKFPLLKHGIMTRHGGVSSSPYLSLNLNIEHQLASADIQANLQKVKHVLNLPKLVWAKQVHQTLIEEITSDNLDQIFTCDAFVTCLPNVALSIKHADCQAALFYDPKKQVIGAAHCGWKGNVQNIYQKMVEKMKALYQSKPEDILVGISPSLEPKHSEFIHYQKEFPKQFWPFQISPNYFDLWAISQMQLEECGIQKSNIEIARMGTYSNPEDFFSYRRDKETGRNLSFICLQSS